MMLKVLVVDDSSQRVEILRRAFEDSQYYAHMSVTYCDSADKGRVEMLERYDLLILDVVIPKKVDAVPHALQSSRLLDDLSKEGSRYIRPNLIIGLTADVSELGVHRENFFRNASVVLDGSLSQLDWLSQVLDQIGILVRANQKVGQLRHDKLLLTIHGIRTHGRWQNLLIEEVRKYSRSFVRAEVKYGFFDILSFSVPWLRQRKARQAAQEVREILIDNSDKEIYVVAHSFGTLVLSEALKSISLSNKINRIILCGSPLAHNYNIDHMVRNSHLLINDCGTRDVILVAAKTLLLGLGEAGRVGFRRSNSATFLNRYFTGGHSLYFEMPDNQRSFAEKYWLPLFLEDSDPPLIDQRQSFIGEDIADLVIKIMAICKPLLYVGVLFAAVGLAAKGLSVS